jgi:hypothetical protein
MEFGKSVSRKVAQTAEFPDHKINFIKLPHHTIETLGRNPLSEKILPHPKLLPVAVIA